MARLALCLALTACGLASKDFDVSEPFQAGGGPPGFNHSFGSSQLTGPLSADVSRISSVTLKAARIDAVDAADSGDLSFLSGATLTITGNGLPPAQIATLAAPPAAGARTVQLQTTSTELKPYLQAGGLLGATITYSSTPITARSLQLTLTLHGSLL